MAEPNGKAWKCANCGVVSPDRVRACNCPTEVLWQEGAGTVLRVKRLGMFARVMRVIIHGKDPA
jgi:hypothetical protein